jgi:hypothetical protein
MKTKKNDLIMQNKVFLWIALATGSILVIPLIAMQFSKEWHWTLFDFLFTGMLLFGSGLTFILAARKARNVTYRIAVGIAVAAALLLVWINAAVGIIGDDEHFNSLYFGVLALGMLGAFLTRFEARRLSTVLFIMALALLVIPSIALIVAPGVMMQPPGIVGVFGLNAIFAFLFSGSALLFRQANTINQRHK